MLGVSVFGHFDLMGLILGRAGTLMLLGPDLLSSQEERERESERERQRERSFIDNQEREREREREVSSTIKRERERDNQEREARACPLLRKARTLMRVCPDVLGDLSHLSDLM